ncbi:MULTISPECIES: HAD domain-containing protein [unclassified Dyella]|uniref:HAD domain-containing protein n=1 Tax=Dyella sp. ASV21 TaxID=2795114 RepID=UPI0021078192|nr:MULTISPECIES: HAD domain-containing protein [unclassified Dyella]
MRLLKSFLDLLLARPPHTRALEPKYDTRGWPGVRGRPILFCDWDGVLHHNQSGTFCWLPELHTVLEACPWLDVVLSTNWRTGSRSYLLQQLDMNGVDTAHLAERVRDVTGPELSGAYARHDEVLAFARSRGVERFVALDDAPFPESCDWLFRTDPNEGIGGKRCGELIAFLQQRLAPR